MKARTAGFKMRAPARAVTFCGVAAIVVIAHLLLGSTGASAFRREPPAHPPANVPQRPLPAACASAPWGPTCEYASIRALDAGRATLGLGPYLLPERFVAMAPERQWLILANLDRIAYARVPISGLSRPLDGIAMAAARTNDDPDPRPALRKLNPAAVLGTASAWAGGLQNGLLAYYGWMYDDGYGGPNLDCKKPSASGCWGHREVILSFPAGGSFAMGGAAVRRTSSYALTIVNTALPYFHFEYTWEQAISAGAGM